MSGSRPAPVGLRSDADLVVDRGGLDELPEVLPEGGDGTPEPRLQPADLTSPTPHAPLSEREVLSPQQAADLLDVSPKALANNWRKWGLIGYRLGPGQRGLLRFKRSEVIKALVPIAPPVQQPRRFFRMATLRTWGRAHGGSR